ncbi:MAG: DNA topoisomerase I [Candidatus Bathyarchaeia archaeon]
MTKILRTLIICEKADAARRLAEALAESKPRVSRKRNLTYFEVEVEDGLAVICPAQGHLYAVDSKDRSSRRVYPVWDFSWRPKYEVERGYNYQKGWLEAIGELAINCDRYINSCDYDIEGSLIGYMILKYACGGVEAKAGRMRFSTLTKSELRQAYENVSSQLDYQLAYAGMCRHEVDWIYGINLSRAMTESARRYSKNYATLSTGRVQGPTLRFIVEREVEVSTHVPIPYWTIESKVSLRGEQVEARYSKGKIQAKSEAERIVEQVKGKSGIVEDVQERTFNVHPPAPFDLTSIQTEAYRHLHLTPSQTLRILERLYLEALVSYPRTSSQKLPPTIGYREILGGLAEKSEYKELAAELLSKTQLKPVEGKKADPAHPAIYPTGQTSKRMLEGREAQILDMVSRRFMAAFAPPAVKISIKATVKIDSHTFNIQGSRIKDPGWIRYYAPYVKSTDKPIPQIIKGDEATFIWAAANQQFTNPPPRYNPSSLLKTMEEAGIGTKSTRAEIIDILYRRGYVSGEAMKPTILAERVINVLTRHCPNVVNVSFTRDLEAKMAMIEAGEKTREEVVLEAVEHLKPVIEHLKAKEVEVGRELAEAIIEARTLKATLDTPCPECGSPLRIMKSRTTGKRFIGCSGAWTSNCRFSLPLPQLGTLKLMDSQCQRCGFQLVMTKRIKMKPMISCPRCYVTKLNKNNVYGGD